LVIFSLNAQNVSNKIEVIGEAEIEVVPDLFEYSIDLQEYNKSETEKVGIEYLEKMLVSAVEEMGFKKEKLTINNIQGNKGFANNNYNKAINFLERRNYVLRVNSIDDINRLIPKLDKLGLSGISMGKKINKKKSETEKILRKKAIENAKEKAISIAESIDKKIGDIILIQEYSIYDLSLHREELAGIEQPVKVGYGGFKTNIDVEKIRLSYKVKVTFHMN
jgi:uncharacterized protein YggE